MSEATHVSLSALLDFGWGRLLAGAQSRDAAARHPTLATFGLSGWPEMRSVVLRAVNPDTGTLEVHTDVASEKVSELREAPNAGLHVWDPSASLQIRLRGKMKERPRKELPPIWEGVPDQARKVYGGHPYPGYAIQSPYDHTDDPQLDRFAVLKFEVAEIELLLIEADKHKRALYRRVNGFSGQWLAP
ncbi:pyridoxamine 5'-phosphate oxidase family protein [Donghicola sp.]|uniref:pyridoxamine 5'-phosphate oxidase family protein n=1 Tax=Donghicola sp. TaxID=1929294 RepID=UPI0025F341EF|nr:pyridoxamine 5'-phosphate oxidase family protein [Donghicola sp.]MCT4577582.1 pyridoxamine 5'-phosphate oxidase family protein [Donghicola sp.]